MPGKINLENSFKDICKELSIIKKKIKDNEDNYNIILNKQNEEIINLKEENKKLNKKIEELFEIINRINVKNINNEYFIDSVIIEGNDLNLIKQGIKKRMNKNIKKFKKLYQASVDGGDPSIFHKKCDNIPNILILIKSIGNRRFGGFASLTWELPPFSYISKTDENSFLFSLDNIKFIQLKIILIIIFVVGVIGVLALEMLMTFQLKGIQLKKKNYIQKNLLIHAVMIIKVIKMLYQKMEKVEKYFN